LTVKLISSRLSVKPLYLPNDTAQHPTRLELSATPLAEPHISLHYIHLCFIWYDEHITPHQNMMYGAEMWSRDNWKAIQ
jgi:hypothetical protein